MHKVDSVRSPSQLIFKEFLWKVPFNFQNIWNQKKIKENVLSLQSCTIFRIKWKISG